MELLFNLAILSVGGVCVFIIGRMMERTSGRSISGKVADGKE